jgi:hypothetical protein
MSKPIKRRGAAYPITANAGPDWSFLKDYAAEDSDESESPEELRERLRSEILAELSATLAVPKEATPVPPPKAQFVRDPSLEKFFEMAAEEKAARRRHGH